ncbi:hypothetical protein SK571_29740 [Lentzea sp. BCCO 10_0798]|uniref:Uncharacterized protein n=1 Tax=Lentzea kristufekii TaxID=3095430 RepID=A0ABU4TZ22_9PSEU|nr:hypothetical protein [Lentzea sp. BCCO 10_0798]MDX8053574.1 hypothetical protein [Lentzea sp. BCCO 10_0798]
MTRTRPELQPRALVRTGLLASGIIAGSFLFMAVGKAFILVAFAMVACLIFYVLAVGGYRPRPSRWAGLPAMVIGIVTVFPSNVGSHSLWLTAFGENLHCNVISIQEHPGRRGPTTYSNELRCGDRQVHYTPTSSRSARNPGAEMDIVVDRTGFVPNLEPDKVGLGHSLMLLVALLMNGVFIFLVAWLPVREPTQATAKKQE